MELGSRPSAPIEGKVYEKMQGKVRSKPKLPTRKTAQSIHTQTFPKFPPQILRIFLKGERGANQFMPFARNFACGSPSLQTLYIYFGVAALVGGIAGASLHFAYGVLVDGCGLRDDGVSRVEEERGKIDGKGKGKGKMKVEVGGGDGSGDWVGRGRGRARGRNGPVMTSTILEEEDSSDVGF